MHMHQDHDNLLCFDILKTKSVPIALQYTLWIEWKFLQGFCTSLICVNIKWLLVGLWCSCSSCNYYHMHINFDCIIISVCFMYIILLKRLVLLCMLHSFCMSMCLFFTSISVTLYVYTVNLITWMGFRCLLLYTVIMISSAVIKPDTTRNRNTKPTAATVLKTINVVKT